MIWIALLQLIAIVISIPILIVISMGGIESETAGCDLIAMLIAISIYICASILNPNSIPILVVILILIAIMILIAIWISILMAICIVI